MKGLQERDHLVALGAIGLRALQAEAAGGFDQSVVRLGTGVGEKNLSRKADVVRVDFLGEFSLERALIEVGNMHQLARLMTDRLDQRRMAMAE